MKNLHLMPMNSTFDDSMVSIINDYFPNEENLFVHRVEREALRGLENCVVDPSCFNACYLNEHSHEYRRIFLHSLFLTQNDVLKLNNDTLSKIVWIVWGHDLYQTKWKHHITAKQFVASAVHACKKILRGTYIREYLHNKKYASQVAKFYCVGVGYRYDARMVRHRFGKNVNVQYLPVFTKESKGLLERLRNQHLNRSAETVNILVGHSGFDFLEHEKYLEKLRKYASDPIHIYMVLSYGASDEKICRLRKIAYDYFSEDKCTIITEMMPREAYFEFLSTMDIAIFPFRHQSALGNTIRMAYMGVKLYLDPRGVLAKGFKASGVVTSDCKQIGKISFEELCRRNELPDPNAPLFLDFDFDQNVRVWGEYL